MCAFACTHFIFSFQLLLSSTLQSPAWKFFRQFFLEIFPAKNLCLCCSDDINLCYSTASQKKMSIDLPNVGKIFSSYFFDTAIDSFRASARTWAWFYFCHLLKFFWTSISLNPKKIFAKSKNFFFHNKFSMRKFSHKIYSLNSSRRKHATVHDESLYETENAKRHAYITQSTKSFRKEIFEHTSWFTFGRLHCVRVVFGTCGAFLSCASDSCCECNRGWNSNCAWRGNLSLRSDINGG